MADGPESLPVIDPETREGRNVSILTDRNLILRAFENGWIDDVNLARALVREAVEDMDAYRAVNPPPDELLDRSMALAKVAQGGANVTAKAISTAEQQGKREGDKHLHIHGGVANMNADELRNYIAARLGSSPDAAERD